VALAVRAGSARVAALPFALDEPRACPKGHLGVSVTGPSIAYFQRVTTEADRLLVVEAVLSLLEDSNLLAEIRSDTAASGSYSDALHDEFGWPSWITEKVAGTTLDDIDEAERLNLVTERDALRARFQVRVRVVLTYRGVEGCDAQERLLDEITRVHNGLPARGHMMSLHAQGNAVFSTEADARAFVADVTHDGRFDAYLLQ
jgi:hypothetical protein